MIVKEIKELRKIDRLFEKFEFLDEDNRYVSKLDIPDDKIRVLGIDFVEYDKIIEIYKSLLPNISSNNFLRSITLVIVNELDLNKFFSKKDNPKLDFLIIREDTFYELKMLNKYLIEIFTSKEDKDYKEPEIEYIKIRI